MGNFFEKIKNYLIPLILGFLYPLSQPPFNHELSQFLSLFPFLTFVVFIPLFYFSMGKSFKKSLLKVYLFGFSASLTQIYWFANVTLDGLWLVIILGMFLASLYLAFNYVIYFLAIRFFSKYGRYQIYLFALFYVVWDYIKTLGDLSFPWSFPGYNFVPFNSLSQILSVTGIYGLTFIAIVGNGIIYNLANDFLAMKKGYRKFVPLIVFLVSLTVISILGGVRVSRGEKKLKKLPSRKIAVIQPNIDEVHWNGKVSLDTSMSAIEDLVYLAAKERPSLIVIPESAVYCYLARDRRRRIQVQKWEIETNIPIILGTLHFERAEKGSAYRYRIYNSAFFIDSGSTNFEMYHKRKLVPFSEALPFEGLFPIISRINLGESDFARGTKNVIFRSKNGINSSVFICYEIIYPAFVRKRALVGTDLLVNITNDGWFGRSTAAFQHEIMARARAIETGVPLVRSANSGISFVEDPYGIVSGKTKLYTRNISIAQIPEKTVPTIYRMYGNWFVFLAFVVLLFFLFVRKRG